MNRETVIDDAISNYWNVNDQHKGKSLEQLKEICYMDQLNYGVCAINITGDLNLGVMMRTASLMGAERFIIYGKHAYDRRSTVGAQNYINVVKAGSIDKGGSLEIDYSQFFPTMEKYGYEPVFIETGGMPLNKLNPKKIIDSGKKPCIIFGNEGIGIDKNLLVGQKVYSIEQRGVLRSLNVCAAASIVMHYLASYTPIW